MSVLLRDIAQGDELVDAHRSSGLDPESAESLMFADGTNARGSKASGRSRKDAKGKNQTEVSKMRELDDSLLTGRYAGEKASLSDLRKAGALPEEQPQMVSGATDAALDALMGGDSDEESDSSDEESKKAARPVETRSIADLSSQLQLTSSSRSNEESRGKAAKLQFDRAELWLQSRVYLQPGLRAANRLPRTAGLGIDADECQEASKQCSDREARALQALPGQVQATQRELAATIAGFMELARASIVGGGASASYKGASSLPMVGDQLAGLDNESDDSDDDDESENDIDSDSDSKSDSTTSSEGGSAAIDSSRLPGECLLPGRRPWTELEGSEQGSDQTAGPELPSSSQIEEALDAWWEGVLPSVEAAVDAAFMRTSRRHRSAGSSAAAASADGSALLKPPSQQALEVATNERARLRRAHAREGTFVPLLAEACDQEEMPDLGGAASSGTSSGATHGLDPGTYEDGDFLQYTMRELSSMGKAAELRKATVRAGSATEEAQAYLKRIRPFAPKRREGVDARASKGRRMRYTVMPKLVGFVAAKPGAAGPPPVDVDTLLRSVFKSNA